VFNTDKNVPVRVRYDEYIDSPLGGRSIFDVAFDTLSKILEKPYKNDKGSVFYRPL